MKRKKKVEGIQTEELNKEKQKAENRKKRKRFNAGYDPIEMRESNRRTRRLDEDTMTVAVLRMMN